MSKETKYRTFTIADMAFDLRVSSRTIRRMIRRKNLEEITQDKEVIWILLKN